MNTVTKAAYEGDIVSRLRNWRGLHLAHSGTLFEEAAGEIERLRLDLSVQKACTVAGREEIARLRDGWIPVSDRLPADGEMVLWWNPKDGYCNYRLAARDGNGLDWGGDLLEPIAAFTHWRHLPDPVS
jgi:hypothetical protein